MKKMMMSLAVLALTAGVVNAQKSSKGGFNLGVQAGILSTGASFDNDGAERSPATRKVGFKVGVNTTVKLSPVLDFVPEINYTNKKMKVSEPQGSLISLDINTNFLEIPLNIVFNADKGIKGLSVGIGPVFSLGLGGSYSETYVEYLGATTLTKTGDVKFDGKKASVANDNNVHLKSLDIGFTAFVGYKINKDFNVKWITNTGFTNLTPETVGTYKPNYVGLTVGYSIIK